MLKVNYMFYNITCGKVNKLCSNICLSKQYETWEQQGVLTAHVTQPSSGERGAGLQLPVRSDQFSP